ncbi:Uncharacterized protein OBRU01_17277 [Operophtera brumata]|uniref:Uncharacterized protein n=1 Tax=Operophtera brumata TaxID=104452 RepID=A0A0L7L0X5_OPEBR|nr:Uncharacterized protein OBRU01_17277 [Operophtera brumata]
MPCRKLTITLTIAVIVAHPACGFALQRNVVADSEPTTNITLEESLQVQNVTSLDEIKQGKDTNTTAKNKNRLTSEQKFIDSTEGNDTRETETQDTSVVDITTTTKLYTSKNEEPEVTGALSSESVSITQSKKTTNRDNTTSPGNISSKDTSRKEFVGNITENLQSTKLTNKSEVSTTLNIITTEAEQRKTELENITISTTAASKMQSEVNSPIELISMNDQIAIDSEATENLTTQQEPFTNGTTENITETDNIDERTKTNSIKSSTSRIAFSKINVKPNNISSELTINAHMNVSSKSDSTTAQSSKHSSEFLHDMSKSASSIVEVEVTKDLSPVTAKPTWKKYTTIKRRVVASFEDTSPSSEKDNHSEAESIQTTLPIPSIEMLTEDLLSNTYYLSTVTESQNISVTAETEIIPTLESIESTPTQTIGTVASKRAGFLDFSKRTSAQYEQQSTDKNTNYSTIYENEPQEIDQARNNAASQSQLTQDEIEEALLKEQIINNNESNGKMYEDGKDESKPSADTNTSQSVFENSLGVQPINQERRTTVYTVGLNYKPMKRIEVQPTKSFIRDPDDNSWRNESISSLGIVFKPKNSSSKSFKEVLKTKTETEFNNLQDKDNKGDTPELRLRLEKIAEVRKSKKKGIDKFGEVIYTDYEESSAGEGTSTLNNETTPTEISYSEIPYTLSSKGPEIEFTLPMTTKEHERFREKELETISKDEMFKNLGLEIRTITEKPNHKPHNSEYYDTTDEYDADYITLPNLDLKKFKVPPKTTSPSPTRPTIPQLTNGTMPPYFPERKPTVQYFPPTIKPQKVNVNDYDVDFERRLRMYTSKVTPETITTVLDDYNEDTDRSTLRNPDSLNKHVYMANEARITEPHNFVINDGNFNRGTYVIKHYRDFLKDTARDEVRSRDFVPYTESPVRHIPSHELRKPKDNEKKTEVDYEYYSQFEKKVLNSFVDTLNKNSDSFKVDFTVLFNKSVIHTSNADEGRVSASSTNSMKRPNDNQQATLPPSSLFISGWEPNCDHNITVELSPAYELHYFVPEQEEKEEVQQPPVTLPYRYNL